MRFPCESHTSVDRLPNGSVRLPTRSLASYPNVKIPPPSSVLPKGLEGTWEGSLDAGGKVRRIGLKLAPSTDGIATAILIALDQGNLEIPATIVTIDGKQLQLEARTISGAYRGTIGSDGEISGEWPQGPSRFPLTFKRVPAKVEKP